MMKICVVGTGYVGLVTGACFAETGNTVWCVDTNEVKIRNLQAGILPIYEPGLKEMVERNVKEGRLKFSVNIRPALENTVFCFIAVDTPLGKDGSADLSQVMNVAQMIGRTMQHYLIVINKSTVPVGTAQKVWDIINRELSSRDLAIEFDVVSNPEFLKEGTAIKDFMRPDRIVIGTDNVHTAELIKQLYEPFVRNQHPLLIMDINSAEITKYAANAMLATRISFMNEIARLCDKVGGDITNVRKGIGTDRRIGMRFLYAGTGYGGSCFSKDVKELINTGRIHGLDIEIATAVDRVNEQQKSYLVEMISKKYGNNLTGKRFAVWGLAFKPQTDDMREAPSIVIIQSLLNMGATITAYDPEAMMQAEKVFAMDVNRIRYAGSMLDALDDADALLLITEWRQFQQPDFGEIKRRLKEPVIFDGRNQYESSQMANLGFEYFCIGRGCCVR
jgi:UDPglucose 6-dehydrogenase